MIQGSPKRMKMGFWPFISGLWPVAFNLSTQHSLLSTFFKEDAMFHTFSKLALAFCAATMLVGCASTPEPQPTGVPEPSVQLANPASENCVAQGGAVVIQKRGDGDEYGICQFEDNRQCEEWALLRGECPVGGVKVTGYVTMGAQFCAITGGTYQVTGNSNTDQEQGTCTFSHGKTCDAAAYFAGQCDPKAETGQSSYDDPIVYCDAVGTIDAPDERYTGERLPASILESMIQQDLVSADAPPEIQQNAVWRCMNGKVWFCHFGANIPCQEKADTSQTPTAEMDEFCKANPTAESIPAAVTGRATVYEWRCKEGKAEAASQLVKPDPQGYLATFWHELTP